MVAVSSTRANRAPQSPLRRPPHVVGTTAQWITILREAIKTIYIVADHKEKYYVIS